jgi:hypothetical protein
VTSAVLMMGRGVLTGFFDGGFAANATGVGPEPLWPLWGVALGAATLALHLRRLSE